MSDQDIPPKLKAALTLARRMPPGDVVNSLAGLIELADDLTDDLLSNVDQPLQIEKDDTGKEFILCDYNRDGDSHRSPWTNKYVPDLDDGFQPNPQLREMEIRANKVFDIYRRLYFEGGYSSVYFFDTTTGDKDFGACFLIHKDVAEGVGQLQSGWWDSIHVFSVSEDPTKADHFIYKMTTTVMVSMDLKENSIGDVDLSGSMMKQCTVSLKVDAKHAVADHIANLGSTLEDMELRIRNTIEGIYIQKTRQVIAGMRSATGARDAAWDAIAKSLAVNLSSKK